MAEILILEDVETWPFCYLLCFDSLKHKNVSRLNSNDMIIKLIIASLPLKQLLY